MASDPGDIAHLLRRTGFTAPGDRVAQLAALEWAAAVEAVLDTSANLVDDIPAEIQVFDQDVEYLHYGKLVWWWLDRCATTPTPIVEKMTMFWHGHFTTAFDKVYNTPALISQHRLYRTHALGDFYALAQGMAVEPAMLVYLDNAENIRESPNQNFARELMELFLLGVGNYTEDDVVAAARAWTGYGVAEWNDLRFVYRPEEHDDGAKTFFGSTRNWTGPEIIAEILTNPAKRPVVASFIATKLWEFFAYQHPEPAPVAAVAQAFLDSNFDIRSALRALFNRPEFRSAAAREGLVRSPIEFVVASLHHTGMHAADINPEWYFANMGQVPFNPPNVSGWRPNGYWVNCSAFAGRAEYAGWLAYQLAQRGWWAGFEGRSVDATIDHGAAVFGLSLSATTRAALTGWLTAQRNSDERWAERRNLSLMFLLTPEMHVA